MNARPRIERLHWTVAAEDNARAGVQQTLECVRVARPCAEKSIRHFVIARRVNRLHRCNHTERAEPRKVGRMQVLRVLDAKRRVESFVAQFLVHVQNLAIRAVADGMRADHHPRAGCRARQSFDFRRRRGRNSTSVRVPFEWF